MLLDKVHNYINHHCLISNNENILIGVSGGSDSLSLLHILATLFPAKRLYAVYINHGLRQREAEREQDFIREICQEYAIAYQISHINTKDFAKKRGCGIEEAARILRYQQFAQRAKENTCTKIAVAHTADDQVEHFFIRLFRGSGIKALSGMRPIGNIPVKPHKQKNEKGKKEDSTLYKKPSVIIRPLLFLHKKELQDYLVQHNFTWCEDSSNNDSRFLRNRIRNELLPMIKQRFSPALNNHILHAMDILQCENDYLKEAAQKAYTRLVKEYPKKDMVELDCLQFQKEHTALQRRILEQCCWQLKTKPSFHHIAQIITLIRKGESGQELHLIKGLRVYRKYDTIIFCYPLQNEDKRGTIKEFQPYSITLSKEEVENKKRVEKSNALLSFSISIEIIPYKERENRKDKDNTTLFIDCDTITFPLLMRPMKEGDIFTPCNTNITKKIGRFFSERKISLPQRTLWPLLLSGDTIIAVAGLQIADFCKITNATKRVLRLKYIAK